MAKPIILPISYKSDPKGLKKAEQDLKGFAGGVGKLVAGAVTAVAGIGIASVRAFANFDSSMTQSLAIMGDVSDSMRNEMSDAARELAKNTTFSATEAADSFYFLASAGLSAEQSVAALPSVAAFAQAGMFDMARATDLLTDAQSALGLSSDDAGTNLANMNRVSDALVKTATMANTSVEQLGEALTEKVGATAAAAGLELESVTGALAVFADSGVKGSAAGTKLTAVIASLQKGARDNTQAFKDLGIAVYDAEGVMRPLEDIIGDMEHSFADMTIEQRNSALAQLGLNRQALDGVNLLYGNADAMTEYGDAARDAAGITDEIAEKQLKTLNAQFEILGSRINDVGIEIGSKLGPTMETLVDQLSPVIDQVGDVLVEAFELLAPVIADFAAELPGLLSALVPILPIMIDIARAVLEIAVQLLPVFLEIIEALLPFVQTFTAFLADNAKAVGGVAIAVAGLVLGIKAFNIILGISKLLKLGWAAATGVATVAVKAFNLALRANPIGLIITAVVALIGALIWFFTQTETGRKIFQGFVNVLKSAWNTIKQAFAIIREGLTAFWNSWKERIAAIRELISGFVKAIPEALRRLVTVFTNIGRNIINGLLNGLKNAWKAVTGWISNAASSVSGAFKKILGISSPSKVFMEHGMDIGKGLQIGLEKIQPKVTSEVRGLVDTGGLSSQALGVGAGLATSSGGAGGGITVVVNAGMGADGAEVGRKVVDAIRQYERRSGKVFAAA